MRASAEWLNYQLTPIKSLAALVLTLLISTAGGRFPRAWLEPRANRMLVMKALRQDVAILAFHPHDALRGLKTHGTALSFVPPKTFCYSRRSRRLPFQSTM